jgi:hypothetical protein
VGLLVATRAPVLGFVFVFGTMTSNGLAFDLARVSLDVANDHRAGPSILNRQGNEPAQPVVGLVEGVPFTVAFRLDIQATVEDQDLTRRRTVGGLFLARAIQHCCSSSVPLIGLLVGFLFFSLPVFLFLSLSSCALWNLLGACE